MNSLLFRICTVSTKTWIKSLNLFSFIIRAYGKLIGVFIIMKTVDKRGLIWEFLKKSGLNLNFVSSSILCY